MEHTSRKRQWVDDQDLAHKRHAGSTSIEIINLVDDDEENIPQRSLKDRSPSFEHGSNIEGSYSQYHLTSSVPGSYNDPYRILSSSNLGRIPISHAPIPNLSGFRHVAPPLIAENAASDDIIPITEPVLCKEQADLVNLILSGRNVFYTGSAGCGKSTVLKAFVKRLTEKGMRVNIIAPTGRAALDINGTTTWSYAGWTPDHHKKPLKELKDAARGRFVRQRLQDTNVLVIDEISMVENLHFERLNAVMKEARGIKAAFGGVQLVVTGDVGGNNPSTANAP